MGHKLYKFLVDKSQENVRYRIIINGKDFYTENEPSIENLESIENCELRMKKENLETIDIIPVLEGAGKIGQIFTAILGAVLIVLGVFTFGVTSPWGVALLGAGLGLLAAGVVGLLTKPPKFEDFREIEQGGKASYLFSGPQNVVGEGGPVPLGYGRLLVGSQVIGSAYVVRDFSTADPGVYLRDEYGNLLIVPPIKPPPVKCCFIFIQGEGILTQWARLYRDTYYGCDGLVANGYRWMAKWLVPLMKKYYLVQNFVKYSMTTPLSRFFEWHFEQNKYGFIFWPFKIWIAIWGIVGLILKGGK
jgi:predicted phage tail protein